MDRYDIINAWLNKTTLDIPELGVCWVQDVQKEDGSGYSFNLSVIMWVTGEPRKVYVSTHPGRPTTVKVASRVKTTLT